VGVPGADRSVAADHDNRLMPNDRRADRTWRRRAACRGADPGSFFPASEEDSGPAKAVCQTCPVRQHCLEWALAGREEGVWGGLTETERNRLRGVRRANTNPAVEPPPPPPAPSSAADELLEAIAGLEVGERFTHAARLPGDEAAAAIAAVTSVTQDELTLVHRLRPDGLVDVYVAAAGADRRAG
jgi:WhiB family redox-sensing transcriptional regulator